MTSFYRRYVSGSRDDVWHELRQLGAGCRAPSVRADVEAVVREAMIRARQNVETIIERLTGQGYRFGDTDNEGGASVPLAPPDPHTPAFLDWLEGRFGPIPLTARAWAEIVGDVSLIGMHPDWPDDAVVDPLVVELEYKSWAGAGPERGPARNYFEGEYEAWRESCAEDHEARVGPFSLEVSPDALHKAKISGGAPYGFLIPDECADGTFRFDDGVYIPFVEYLRLAFSCGGFPGLWKRGVSEAVWRRRRELAEGLLRI